MTKNVKKEEQAEKKFELVYWESEWHISLPWSAFFDQELGDVIYNKLMKAPVKDVQVLLWLSKLWQTVNSISKALVEIRDRLAEEAGVSEYLHAETPLTPEVMNSAEYQEKSKKFWELLQENIFSKVIDLAPLWSLTLDLTNPDWHAKSFIENANLSTDDVMKLEEAKIVVLKTWEEDVLVPEKTEDEQN